MNSAPVFITGGVVGAGGSAPVPGPGAGEVPGVVGVGAAGALDGVAELDVDVSELDVTPPQFPSTITSSATKQQPSRRMAVYLLRWENMLYSRRAQLN